MNFNTLSNTNHSVGLFQGKVPGKELLALPSTPKPFPRANLARAAASAMHSERQQSPAKPCCGSSTVLWELRDPLAQAFEQQASPDSPESEAREQKPAWRGGRGRQDELEGKQLQLL